MTWSAMFRMVLATLAKNMGENIQWNHVNPELKENIDGEVSTFGALIKRLRGGFL